MTNGLSRPDNDVIKDSPTIITINVRWWDGYLETFEATEVRFGYDLLWIRLTSGQNRHIPTRHVCWFSTTPESHEHVSGLATP
jgi:hypothetical protein